MRKNIWIFGIIAGLISASWFIGSMLFGQPEQIDFENGMWIGFTSMFLAFSLIFIAIKNFRDKFNAGAVSFGGAFKIGLYISLIASTIYVLVWLIDYYVFIPDFGEKYSAYVLEEMKTKGSPQAEIDKQAAEMSKNFELYKNNPLVVIGFTYMEILPVGIIISLIAALILKRKKKDDDVAIV